jgi:hypothetical protein
MNRIMVNLPDDESAWLDANRGIAPKAQYLRQLLREKMSSAVRTVSPGTLAGWFTDAAGDPKHRTAWEDGDQAWDREGGSVVGVYSAEFNRFVQANMAGAEPPPVKSREGAS